MNRAARRRAQKAGISPEIIAEVSKQLEHDITDTVFRNVLALIIIYLHDKRGWKQKSLHGLVLHLKEQLNENIDQGWYGIEDVHKTLKEELDIEIDTI